MKLISVVLFRSAKYLVIERLLVLARMYITTVEDQYHDVRTILPHGASFQGPPITFQVCCESPRMEFPCVVSSFSTFAIKY